MKFPNPNLVRFIRPMRLQMWCARRGFLTGRWTTEDIAEIHRRAHARWEWSRKNFD